MSPEVIRGMGYGFSCDWWSLGVIGTSKIATVWLRPVCPIPQIDPSPVAFECLFGYPPFVSNSVSQLHVSAVGEADSELL
jgi:protein-serine/threonine kinase